jgi:site-specific DNA recombinase
LFAPLIRAIREASIIPATASNGSNWHGQSGERWRASNLRKTMGQAPMKSTQKTAAIYARFSSDLQKDRSIDDQFELCEQYAKREGLKIVARFSDRAKTGSSMFDRDGLRDLRNAAKAGKFNAVIVECLDRLSRDQEDLAGLFKRLIQYRVETLTVNEGKATDMHVGLRGMYGAMYITDLTNRIKRAQAPLVREKLFPGAVTYGYDRVLGKPGERTPNTKEAMVIERIFRDYAAGTSPREIAARLTRDGIPSPSGGKIWSHQSLTTGGAKASGILGNRLYIGEIVWNQHYTVTDPDTHSKSRRARPADEHIAVSAPHLRIIDDALWHAVQAVRKGRAVKKFGPTGKLTRRRPVIERSQHLLSGLLRCGACNGHMIITKVSRGERYVACSAAHQKGTCSHTKGYLIDTLKDTVLEGMRKELVDPEAIAEAARAYHAEYAAQERKNRAERLAAEKQRDRLVIQIDRIVAAIADGDDALPALLAALKAKEVERVGLDERLRQLTGTNVISLHPNVMRDYRANVEKLHLALVKNPGGQEERLAFRNIVDSVVVHPTAVKQRYEISVYGRLSAVMGVELFPTARSSEEIIAQEGFGCGDNGNAV